MSRDWKECLVTEFGYSESLIDTLLKHGKIRQFSKDVRVLTQGGASKQLLFILEGNLTIIRDKADATEQLVGMVTVGHLMNEAYFYGAQPANCHIYTLTNVTSLCLSPKSVNYLIKHDLEFNQAMARSLSRKMLLFSNMSYAGHERDKTAKVCKATYYLFKSTNLHELSITIVQLASMLGMSRNTVSQVLKECEERGGIQLLPRSVVLKDINKIIVAEDVV